MEGIAIIGVIELTAVTFALNLVITLVLPPPKAAVSRPRHTWCFFSGVITPPDKRLPVINHDKCAGFAGRPPSLTTGAALPQNLNVNSRNPELAFFPCG